MANTTTLRDELVTDLLAEDYVYPVSVAIYEEVFGPLEGTEDVVAVAETCRMFQTFMWDYEAKDYLEDYYKESLEQCECNAEYLTFDYDKYVTDYTSAGLLAVGNVVDPDTNRTTHYVVWTTC